jgi:hypothetical protein
VCDESSDRTQQALRALTVAAAAAAAWCVLASALQSGNLFASLTLAAADSKGARRRGGPRCCLLRGPGMFATARAAPTGASARAHSCALS